MKVLIGGGLTFLVIVLLAGPILLFSSFNPIAVVNPTLGSELEVRFEIRDIKGSSRSEISLFSTS